MPQKDIAASTEVSGASLLKQLEANIFTVINVKRVMIAATIHWTNAIKQTYV